MKKIIAIGGEPATGKSTLIKEFMKTATDWEPMSPVPLINGYFSYDYDLALLGKYEEGEQFPGTDRFSMAVQPQAEKYLYWLEEMNAPHPNVLFEGDRLFNAKFLEFCLTLEHLFELHIILLKASRNQIDFRHKDRKDSQDEKFIKGRRTKYENIKANFALSPYIETWMNETPEDLIINSNKLTVLLRN